MLLAPRVFPLCYILIFQYKGFPSKFTTTKDLETFLTRFIWLAVKHAINSYPLIPYGAFVPSAPTKLYQDPQATHYAHSLPNALVVLVSELIQIGICKVFSPNPVVLKFPSSPRWGCPFRAFHPRMGV